MIVDASAVLAMLLDEPDRDRFARVLAIERELSMSPVNYVEASIRLQKLGRPGEELDRLMQLSEIVLADVTPQQAEFAREAYARFGKGNHPAGLNLGDCFAYALARARNEPLLFKGDDFRQTDIEAAS